MPRDLHLTEIFKMEDIFGKLIGLQSLATAFGIVQVILSRRNNIHNYLFGIVSIVIGMWVLYEARLYADILLHLYYLVMSVYGWLYWKYGRESTPVPITYSSREEWLIAFGIVAGCFLLMLYWLSNHTNSDVPLWDAAVSAFAWAGMWLMARRKMENWIFLNISNSVAIPLLFYKGLQVYALLSVFLFIMGVSGYLKWKKIIENEHELAKA